MMFCKRDFVLSHRREKLDLAESSSRRICELSIAANIGNDRALAAEHNQESELLPLTTNR